MYEIYDVQRRWFSEVIATTQAGNPASGAPMIELLSHSRFSAAGNTVSNPPFSAPPVTTVSTTSIKRNPAGSALEKSLDALCSAGVGSIRIAFRVLTNRGNDDEDSFASGFTSFTRGAAIIDDVVIQKNGTGANLITNGDFEADNAINNRPATTNGCPKAVLIMALWLLPETMERPVTVTAGITLIVNVTVFVLSLASVAVTLIWPEAWLETVSVLEILPLASVRPVSLNPAAIC